MSEKPLAPHQKPFAHCREAEAGVLAAMIHLPHEFPATCAQRKVKAEWFYHFPHRMLFNAMMAVWERGATIEMGTVAGEIGWEEWQKNEFPVLFNELSMLTIADADAHLEVIRDNYVTRRIYEICHNVGQKARTDEDTGENLLAAILTQTADIAAPVRRAPTLKELVFDKMRRMQENEQDTNILKTGFDKLDKASPMRLGNMPLLSGERKAGKSMVAMNIAVNLAQDGHRGVYYSLEMPAEELVDRIYAKLSRIPTARHNKDGLDTEHYRVMQPTVESMATMPLEIRDDLFDLQQIVGHLRQIKAMNADLKFAVIDYAQLVRVSLGKGFNREQEVAHVSRCFRLLSMELRIALLVLCQLNKEGESRESKALEQDCTAMWKITTVKEAQSERAFYIPFQRSGPSGVAFKVTYLGETCRVLNYAGGDEIPEEVERRMRQGHPNARKNH